MSSSTLDWEDLDADDDDPPMPPSGGGGGVIVDRTPLIHSHKKQSLGYYYHNEKTPLISHKSSSGLSAMAATVPSYQKVTVKEEVSFSHDDEKSVSSVASILSWSTASSLVTLSTAYLGNFKSSLMIPFTDDTGSPGKICTGLLSLFSIGILLGLVLPKDEHLVGRWYPILSSILGYTYFLCWSCCFYPQVLLNWKRKSTVGLSHDFAILNFLGWSCYAAYECAMYFDETIIALYRERFHSRGCTVQSNDVAFALHAMALATAYLIQIVYYGNEKRFRIKRQTYILIACVVIPSFLGFMLISAGVLKFGMWLDYFYMLSFLKISCTMTKYTKQVIFNMERQSTQGWNIWYNFLECVGGTLSMTQVVLDSANMNDWTGVTGNMAKFALGFLTIFFDVLFFLQHYVIYPHRPEKIVIKEDIENMNLDIAETVSIEDLSLTERE